MPFNNDIAGGNGQLVRNWIQSQNYTPGVSGWRISKNGNAEFNNGTFRGSIEVGSLTGQHFFVNNPNTGDVIDVYNSSNQLVFSISSTGRLVSQSAVSTANIVMVAANLFFEDTAQSPLIPPQETGTIAPNQSSLNLSGGQPQNFVGISQAFLNLITGTTTGSPWANISQRNVQGAVVQTDVSTNANQLLHTGTYTFTTNGVGNVTFNHNCSFTPTGGWLAPMLAGGAGWSQYAWFTNPFSATQASAAFWNNLGATVNNTTIEAFGLFVG